MNEDTEEILSHDPDSGERADAQEAALNARMGIVGPTPGPWIVDEVNTPNGVSYFINHLWDEDVEDGDTHTDETHTDEIAEVVMDYQGDRALCNARLLAAAPDLRDALLAIIAEDDRLIRTGDCITNVGSLIDAGRKLIRELA